MPIYKIVSLPVSIPYAFDGKSGVSVKLCVASVDDKQAVKKLSVFKVSPSVQPEKVPSVGSLCSLSFDEYGRVAGFGQLTRG